MSLASLARPMCFVVIGGLSLCMVGLHAQGIGINADGASPHASALLDVDITSRTSPAGMLVPRMTEAERLDIVPPGNSLLVYQTDQTRGFWYYDGTAAQWLSIGSTAWNTTGNVGTVPVTNAVGTNDAQNWVVRTNNVSRMRITTVGQWVPTTTGNNVAIGANAGENGMASAGTNAHNVFLGEFAGDLYNGCVQSTFVGGLAGQYNTSGNNNAAIGHSALRDNSTGTRNTAAGAYASTGGAGDFTHSTIIGGHSQALGHGTTVGAYSNANASHGTALGYEAEVTLASGSDRSLALGAGSVTNAADQVRVGNAFVTDIGGYAPWSDLSDERFKRDIRAFTNGRELVMGLRPVNYRIDRAALAKHIGAHEVMAAKAGDEEPLRTGFLAQEVEALLERTGIPFHGLHVPVSDTDHYGLAYTVFVVPLVQTVQELHERIASLREEQQELITRALRAEERIGQFNTMQQVHGQQ